MKKINKLLLIILVSSCIKTYCQVGFGTNAPHSSAVLELKSTNKGLLIPRMTKIQRDQINTPILGMLLYCTNCSNQGLYHYVNSKWTFWGGKIDKLGDIKQSYKANDHQGWIKLNGREISELTPTQKNVLENILNLTALPNADNAYLTQPTQSTNLGKTITSSALKLISSDIPSLGNLNVSNSYSVQNTLNYDDFHISRVQTKDDNDNLKGSEVFSDNNENTWSDWIESAGRAGDWTKAGFKLYNYTHNISINSSSHSHSAIYNPNNTHEEILINHKNFYLNTFIYLGN